MSPEVQSAAQRIAPRFPLPYNNPVYAFTFSVSSVFFRKGSDRDEGTVASLVANLNMSALGFSIPTCKLLSAPAKYVRWRPVDFFVSLNPLFACLSRNMALNTGKEALAIRVIHTRDAFSLTRHNSVVDTIIILNAAFVAVITILINVRLYVRLRLVRRLGSDDSKT